MLQTKKAKISTAIIFGIYMFLLIWLILFKFQYSLLQTGRSINLIPFAQSVMYNGRVSMREPLYNLIVFIPLGVYTAFWKPEWGFVKKSGVSFAVSLLFELLQFLLAIGASDITDLLMNTAGGMAGILLAWLFIRLFCKKALLVTNIAGAAVETVAVFMLALLLIANR